MSNPSTMTELESFLSDTRRNGHDEDRAVKSLRQAKDLPPPLVADITAAVAEVMKAAYPDSTKIGQAVKQEFPGLIPDAKPGLEKLMRRPISGITAGEFALVGSALAALPCADPNGFIHDGKVCLAAIARECALAADEPAPSNRLAGLFTPSGDLRPEVKNLTVNPKADWLASALEPHRPAPKKSLRRRVMAYFGSAWNSSVEAVTQGKAAFIIPLILILILGGVLLACTRTSKPAPTNQQESVGSTALNSPPAPPPKTVIDALRQQLKGKEFLAKLQSHTVLIFPHPHAPAVEAALTEALSPAERVLPVSVAATMFGNLMPPSSAWLRPADIAAPICCEPADMKKLLLCYTETLDGKDRIVMSRFEPHQLVAVIEAPAPAKSAPPSAEMFKGAADKLRAAGLGNTEPALRWLRMAESAASSPLERASIAAQRALVMKENGQRDEALALLLAIHQHLPEDARAWADPLLREGLKVSPQEAKK